LHSEGGDSDLEYAGRKGWRAVAACDIKKGEFVAEYAGELVKNDEAARRLAVYDAQVDAPGHALLVNPRLLGLQGYMVRLQASCHANPIRFFRGGTCIHDVPKCSLPIVSCHLVITSETSG
jgi:hypothetical protein